MRRREAGCGRQVQGEIADDEQKPDMRLGPYINSPEDWGEALGGKTGDDASVSSANPVCSLVWDGEVVRSPPILIRVLFEASTYPSIQQYGN